MKIGVMGAGAVGCFVGGQLIAAGEDVVLVARDRVKREVDEHGLRLGDLEGGPKIVTPPRGGIVIVTDPGPLADRDVVLVCVKSDGTAAAAKELAGILRPDALVVSLQNGLRNADELRAELSQAVLAGIVNFNILSKGEGLFKRATSGPLLIESTASTDTRSVELSRALEAAGFDVERPRDIRGVQWSKLLINLNNAISALSDRPTKELVLSAGYRRVLSAILSEALGVLAAAGIRPAKLGRVPVTVLPFALRLPTALVQLVARAQLRIDPEARSSMWEDLTRGRRTEVDYINGEIVALAARSGTVAPLNQRIVARVHEAEEARAGSPKLSAEALWIALTS